MNFPLEKKQALEKAFNADKSKKGEIDKQILPLVNLINRHQDFYTTSSCAGRIMLFKESEAGKKGSEWLFISHDKVSFSEIKPYLISLPEETLWLRMEPPILHICAKDMESADRLLKFANDSGFRRSSVLGFKKRIIIEIMIPEKLDAPVSENNKLIVTEEYIKTLLKHANQRLSISRKKLKKLEKEFSKLLP
jgi:tRNA wybutosine-synthesizing protein 3